MYKYNNGINLGLFLRNCFLSCLLTVVPHSPEQTQVASILLKDSFNQWSCVFYLLDKLILKTAFSKHSCLVKSDAYWVT